MKCRLLMLIALIGGAVSPGFSEALPSPTSTDVPVSSNNLKPRQREKTPIARPESKSALVVATAATDPGGSNGGGESEATGAIKEVIVTAQKYRQRAFDVPISMSVIAGPELSTLGVTDFSDLQFQVPGLSVDDTGNDMEISLRGISNLSGQWALVGTYVDEADATSEIAVGAELNTYDLARVEVLNGPQGTLYGEGSVGGTIRYITNKPLLDRFEMLADVKAMFIQYGAPGDRVNAVVNAPVVNGVLGIRIAADLDHEGGWIDQPAANVKNINSKNLADARIEARWKPGQNLTVDVMQIIHRNASGPYTGENPPGTFTQVFGLTNTPSVEDNYNLSNVTLNWDLGPVTVVNSSTYFTHHLNETNFGATLPILRPPLPAFQYYYTSLPTIDESFSDELRLSSADTGPWRWTVGGFFKSLDDSSPLSHGYLGLPIAAGAPLPPPFPIHSHVHSKSTSGFGDTNYRIFGRFVVGAGVRYFRDDESAVLLGDAQREMATFTSVDPRFYVRYEISPDVNAYASAAKGFRSGGFNGLGDPEYQPEKVWTYDLGTKMRLLDHHLDIDSDIFFSNYDQYQILGVAPPPAPPLNITRNAGNARIKGVEGDVIWMPTDEWRFGASADYIDARFVKIDVIRSRYDVGDPLDFVPRYQVTASMERDFSWLDRPAFARIDYTQRAPESFRDRAFGPWYYSESGHLYLLNFHTGINWTPNLKLGFFIENLLNDRVYVGPEAIQMHAAREQPRTFGVSFGAKFE